MPVKDNRLRQWILERRYTEGLEVERFFMQLGNWARSDMARKIKLNDPQRFGGWVKQNRLPWAVYLALLKVYGTPKFHDVPAMTTALRPCRLPPAFEKLVSITSLEELEPAESATAAPPVPIQAEVTPDQKPVVPSVQNMIDPATSRAEIVIRIEIVQLPNQEQQIQESATSALLERIRELEAMLPLEAPPTGPPEPPSGARPSKHQRHLIRNLSKHDPKAAKVLSKSILHSH